MNKIVTGTCMKKLLTAFIIFVYFVPASIILTFYKIFSQEMQESLSILSFMVPLLLMLTVCVLVAVNIAGAVYSVIHTQTLSFKTIMVFKLCLIPFYIVNFACWLLASMVFHIALVIWPIIPFIIAYTYFTMIGTSVHTLAKLIMLRRDGTITIKQLIIHFIWQIIFIGDVIDIIYLSIKKKNDKFKNDIAQNNVNKFLLPFCCLCLILLSGCAMITGSVINNIMIQTSVTIKDVTYRSGFYGEMFPMFGEVGNVGSETLQEETLYSSGLHEFRRVEFEGHDWVHSYVGKTTGGTVYCAEGEWEQTRDYYADPANFKYYCGGREYYVSPGSRDLTKIDVVKFDQLLAFADEYGYKPFDQRSNKKAMQIVYRLPAKAFTKGLGFFKVSNDGYFMIGREHEYFVYDGKLILVFYHDGGRDNGGIKEVVCIDVPEELGKYFIDLMERKKE